MDFQTLVGRNLYGNPNNASVVYLTSLGLGLHHLRNCKTRKGLAAGAVFVEVIAVLMTGSTGAVSVAVILGLLATLHKVDSTAALVRLCATLLTFGFGVAVWRIGNAGLGSTSGAGPRVDARVAAIQTIPGQFWFGAGPGSDGSAMIQQLSTAFGVDLTGTNTTAHDMFLNWGLDLGVPSMLLLLTAVLVAASHILRSGDWTRILPLLGFVLGAEAAGISTVTPSNPSWAVLLWTLLGLGWATSKHAVSSDELALEHTKVRPQGESASKVPNYSRTAP
jgi:hypothetical protein